MIPSKFFSKVVVSIFCILCYSLISCDTNSDDGGPAQPEPVNCIITEGDFPRFVELPPVGDNGSYDPTLAGDPVSGRVWMVFSRVDGPGGEGKVSTHLAYSDNHGQTWCYVNEINASENVEISTLPDEHSSGISAHWSHEVPSIAYNPAADPSERWIMTWHRYLHVNDGLPGTDDRKFANGWIGMKTASSPELFASQPEIKLFAALGYYKDGATESYNNGIGGPVEVKLHELDPALASSVIVTESGMQVFNNELYISFLSADLNKGNTIILIKKNLSGQWTYVSDLLSPADAMALNPNWGSFSATDLFAVNDTAYLLVSPVIELYEGLAMFQLDLSTGKLIDTDNNVPDMIWSLPKPGISDIFQSGVGTYDELSFNSGILYGDAVFTMPQFKIYATGYIPE